MMGSGAMQTPLEQVKRRRTSYSVLHCGGLSLSCNEMTSAEKPNVEFAFFNFALLSDGSIHRAPYEPPLLPPSPFCFDKVATKDVTLNHGHGTWVRLFLPPRGNDSDNRKLPILLYFHGGGFVNGSTAVPRDHGFLSKLAARADVLIVSVEHRLAPENPLPAAYEDCFEGLLWLNEQAKSGASSADPWLASHADFRRCFLGGDSSGSNIVHHVAMKAVGLGWGEEKLGLGQNLEDISLEGLIHIHPFFTCGASTISSQEAYFWKLSGVSKDHPFANPLVSAAPSLARAALPRTLVALAGKDHLRGPGMAYYQALVEAGKEVRLFDSEGESHVFHLLTPDSENVPAFLDELAHFINL